MPAKTIKIEQRTIQFIKECESLQVKGKLPTNGDLAKIIGLKAKSSISEIRALRQNIQPAQWEKFKLHFKVKDALPGTGIPLQEQLAMIIQNQVLIMKKLGIQIPDKTRTKKA
jgi:hypothetical protein